MEKCDSSLKGSEVKINGRAYYYENFNFNDFEEVAVVEKLTSSHTGLRYREGGPKGIADVVLTIKGNYSFEKHGFSIGGSNGPKQKVRICIDLNNLILI